MTPEPPFDAAAPLPPPVRARGLIEPIGGKATLLVALLGLMVAVCLYTAVVLLHRAEVLGDAGATDGAVAEVVDRGIVAKRVSELGVRVTAVVWIWWQFHYVRNVRRLGRPTGFAPGWAIAGWIVPGANLVVPQVQLGVSAESSDPSDPPTTPAVLYAWWVACVVTVALLVIGLQVRPPEHEFARSRFSEFQAADRLHGVSMLTAAAAAVLAILTVLACTRRQEQLVAQLAPQLPTGHQPAAFPPAPPLPPLPSS